MKTDYIDSKGRKVYEETDLSGKVHKIDVDVAQARIDKLNEIQGLLNAGKLTPQEATKMLNDFGRKHKHFIKS